MEDTNKQLRRLVKPYFEGKLPLKATISLISDFLAKNKVDPESFGYIMDRINEKEKEKSR